MAAPIRPRHFMLASADDHVELLLDQHPHHVRRGPGIVCEVAVGHDVDVGIDVREHAPNDVALALLALGADDSARRPCKLYGAILAVVVVCVDRRARQRRAEAGDRLGDRRLSL